MRRRSGAGSRLIVGGVVAALFGLGCAPQAAPRRQVVVVVDTDAPVPSWIDRLSVEVYDVSFAARYEARDYPMPNPSDWPLSFGERPAVEQQDTPVRFGLRLRAYDSTHLRSIYSSRDATLGGGVDQADPITVIDRLARVSADGTGIARVRIVLRGDCVGVAANVPYRSTCVSQPDERVDAPSAAAVASPAGDVGPTVASAVGTWGAAQTVPCVGAPRAETGLHDEDVCIPGGVFVLGDSQLEGAVPYGDKVDPVPERIAQLSPFYLDRYEVSVARFRAAMADATRPFVPPVAPHAVGSPLTCGDALNFNYCTWRGLGAAPDAALDELPVTCVTFDTARAFCQWAGGDLPSEAQWEFAATRAFKAEKSAHPWLGATPSCGIASFGRRTEQTSECGHETVCGPLPVGAPFGDGPRPAGCAPDACVRDETPGPGGVGIVGLGGNVSEWVRDLQVAYTHECWQRAPRLDPACESADDVSTHMFRGGAWALASWLMNVVIRTGGAAQNPLLAEYGSVGFRCLRRGGGP